MADQLKTKQTVQNWTKITTNLLDLSSRVTKASKKDEKENATASKAARTASSWR
jgi:hypothetical protein